MFALAAGATLQIGSSLLSGRNKKKVARAQAEAARRIAEAENRQRMAKNKASAAAADLQRTVQGINNARALKVGATNDAFAKAQLNAMRDAQTGRTFEGRVQAAERAGGLATAAALAGVAGGSYDAIQGTLALQQARIEERAARGQRTQEFQAEVGIANQASNLIAGIDTSVLMPTIDRTVNNTNIAKPPGNVWSDLAEGVNSVGTKTLGAAAEQVWGGVQQKLASWDWSTAQGQQPAAGDPRVMVE